jgi:hypothetical protein
MPADGVEDIGPGEGLMQGTPSAHR